MANEKEIKSGSRLEKYVKGLAALIQKETVSVLGDSDLTKFHEFHQLLREKYPTVFATCSFKEFDGSILLLWEGTDKEKLPVMFMNHHDVVEATGSWEHPPFSGEVADGKLWGRGTLDTKTGLWAMLQAAEELMLQGFVPSRNIYFESTCCEETTGNGARTIAKWMKEEGIRLEALFDEGGTIKSDPFNGVKGTFAMIGLGEKGVADMKFIARSAGGHASVPPRNTPLIRLAKFMTEVEETQPFKLEFAGLTAEMFKRLTPFMTEHKFMLSHPERFKEKLTKVLAESDLSLRAMLGTTLAFTMAKGSGGANVIPQEAYVVGNMRFSHHEGRDGAINALKPIADKYEIEIDVYDPGFSSKLGKVESFGFELTEKCVKKIFPWVDACIPCVMTGASDAAYYDEVCETGIRFLPFKMSEEQAAGIHGLNENIDISCLEPAVDFYKEMMTGC